MNMSHELRTPLNAVLTATDLISVCDTKEEIEEIQELILNSGKSLLKTIEAIIDFTNSKDGKIELELLPFSLEKVISKAKTSFFYKGTILKLNLNFDFDLQNTPNMLIGDKNKIIEVLNHIFENAAKFTNTSQATLKIDILEKFSKDVLLQFSIIDDGIGIDKENLEKVFDPFFQVDTSTTRKYDGLGIGLSLCRQFVELMGGKIWVESNLGQGSKFFFTIKLERQDTDQPFNLQLTDKNITDKEDLVSNKEHETIKVDIDVVSPIIIKLKKIFSCTVMIKSTC